MSPFKSWLMLWIAVAMVGGVALGTLFPAAFQTLGSYNVASVNPLTAVLVWLLVFPSMVQVDYSQLKAVWHSKHWRWGSALTTGVNWLVKPFLMLGIATFFLTGVFSEWLHAEEASGYIAGLVLLGIAPCAGMVFVWSRMVGGSNAFTVAQVSLNNVILIFAFGPLAALLLGIGGVSIPWETLGLATLTYVVTPMIAGYGLQRRLKSSGAHALERFDQLASPLTKVGLIALVVLLFGFQAHNIVTQPLLIVILAVPVVVQTVLVFTLAAAAAYALRLPTAIGGPAALIGTSNFFELAVAVAIVVFGASSPAAIATTVGVLVEVPAMLMLVAIVNRLEPRYQARTVAA